MPTAPTPTSQRLRSAPWWIGLHGWVLQAGNYTDFMVGQRRQFALEFAYSRARRLKPDSPALQPHCQYTGRGTLYDVAGPLVQAGDEPARDLFVCDFGLVAYTNWLVLDDMEPPSPGTWLTGEVALSVDPFDYMDRFTHRPGVPPLIYTWRIEDIQLSTTPRIEVEYGHPLYSGPDEGRRLVEDPTRETWRSIDRTRMWADNGHYRLRCTRENHAPTSSMDATGPASPYGPLKSP